MRTPALWLCIAMAAACARAVDPPTEPPAQPTPQEIFAAAKAQPIRHVRSYTFDPASELAARIQPCPNMVVKQWAEWDGRDDYASHDPTPEERALVARTLEQLPPLNRRVLRERLLGLYFIENLLGNGIADWVLDEQGRVFTYLVLHPRALTTTLSELITQKERTAFRPDDPSLSVSIEAGDAPGLLYILLHETTHIVDYVERVTPYVEDVMVQVHGGEAGRAFVEGVWAGYRELAPGVVLPQRKDLGYYGMFGGPKLDLSGAAGFYAALAGTPFPSSYATLTWAEDLAELVTFAHLTERLGAPYRIVVRRDGAEIFVHEPLRSPRVRERLARIARFFEDGP